MQCFNHSTHEKFKTLIENKFPHEIETLGVAIFHKIHRETCFEKIIEVIEKLKTINKIIRYCNNFNNNYYIQFLL